MEQACEDRVNVVDRDEGGEESATAGDLGSTSARLGQYVRVAPSVDSGSRPHPRREMPFSEEGRTKEDKRCSGSTNGYRRVAYSCLPFVRWRYRQRRGERQGLAGTLLLAPTGVDEKGGALVRLVVSLPNLCRYSTAIRHL